MYVGAFQKTISQQSNGIFIIRGRMSTLKAMRRCSLWTFIPYQDNGELLLLMSSHNPKEKLDAIIVNENFRILHEAREFAPGKRLQLFQIPDALSPKVDGWLNSVESDQNGGKQQQQQAIPIKLGSPTSFSPVAIPFEQHHPGRRFHLTCTNGF
nr:uncharacterized protein LOC109402600 [Aedes albopictus]